MSELLEAIELHPIRIPMRYRFRRVDHREAVLVRGPAGWGEFSPFPDYPAEVTTRWLASALEAACSTLPEPGRSRIPVNVTIPAVSPEIAAALVMESGARTAKVKVGDPGTSPEDDEERLDAVVEALGPGGQVRIDVNALWTLDEATERLRQLSRFEFEYVEQPVATIEEMIELRRRTGVRLAADELVRLSPDPLRVVESGAADVLVVKVQPMGGVGRVVDFASRSQIPVVISSALETSVGMYSGLLAASLLEDLPYACGLGTVSLLQGDPTLEPRVGFDGYIEVKRVDPDPELLERWRPDRVRSAEMLRKVRAAARVLT
ncbi:MAG TPA: o-succinylbenzoate synthase [Acidimicrobiia bacterium]|nr:o-succinylbenzoate synthase [Acidimicrobiia bacterium]